MTSEMIDRELQAVRHRCEELIQLGHLSGVRDPGKTALQMAVLEHLRGMTGSDLVRVLREGLDESVAESSRKEIRELVRNVLVSRANESLHESP